MTMIKGGVGGKGNHASNHAGHLLRTDDNDRVEFLEHDESAVSLEAELKEMVAISRHLCGSDLGFYHANINPHPGDRELTNDEWIKAADILEKHLEFEGQKRLIVLHEKNDRTHIHVVWQRTDIETGKLRDYKHNYRKHENAAREIEKELDLTLYIHPQDKLRDAPNYGHKETQQAERTGQSVQERKALITDLYHQSEDNKAFVNALRNHGWELAQGDKAKGAFMIVDPAGEAFPLFRQITDKKLRAAEFRKFMEPMQPGHFKRVSQIKADMVAEKSVPILPEDPRAAIEAEYDKKSEEMTARHQKEIKDLQDRYKSQNKELGQERGLKILRDDLNRRKNPARRIKKQPIKRQNLTWWDQDKRNQAMIRVAHDRLLKQQEREKEALSREKAKAYADVFPESDIPKHARTVEDDKILIARNVIKNLRDYETSPDSVLGQAITRVSTLNRQKAGDEKRLTTFLYHLEQSKALFRASYEDAEKAYNAFRSLARTEGLRKAEKALTASPEQFGDVFSTPPSQEAIDQVHDSLRSVQYTEKKMAVIRKRLEPDLTLSQAQIDHGTKLTPANWQNLQSYDQQISAAKEAIAVIRNTPTNEHLAHMRQVQKATDSIDDKLMQRLSPKERVALSVVRQAMTDPELRRRADQTIDRQRRAQFDVTRNKEQDRGDPRDYLK